MQLDQEAFGNHNGLSINQYILTNDQGMIVKLTNYGATITSISVPGEAGKRHDLVCGFDNLEGYFSETYQKNAPYFGCTVGRYASRIKDGKFELEGKTYTLAVNDGSNHLHGGLQGFNKKVWSASPLKKANAVGVKMTLQSSHLEEGYPGNLDISVVFLLNNENELSINYEATTDRTTPLSLTNHTYFNLSGFQQTIGQHVASVKATTHLPPDETNVPVGGVLSLAGTAADLSSGKLLSEAFAGLPTGFEHYFVFDKEIDALEKVAEFTDTTSQRKLEVSTSEPGMLFYTGYFTSDELQRENGNQYGRYRGFCCETHRYPNGPNIADSPGSLTKAGEPYISTTIFKISW